MRQIIIPSLEDFQLSVLKKKAVGFVKIHDKDLNVSGFFTIGNYSWDAFVA